MSNLKREESKDLGIVSLPSNLKMFILKMVLVYFIFDLVFLFFLFIT